MKTVSIGDSKHCSTGTMICQKCHKKIITGLYLSIYYHISKRGNEEDYTRQWHFDCNKEHPAWKIYFENEKKSQEKFEKLLRLYKNEAIKLINNSTDIGIYTENDFVTIKLEGVSL